MLAIDLQDLRKQYGPVAALDGLTLQVPAGSIYGLLGVNGAGKTTLLRLLMGFLHPTGGAGTVLGFPLGQQEAATRARIGYVPERPVLYPAMTVAELMAFGRGVHPRWDPAAATRYLEIFRLPPGRRVRNLSAGMLSQLALCVALAGGPDLLLLDEPAAGLDPVHRRRYLQVLLEESATEDRTILMASHDLALMERACDHVALIHAGRVQVAGRLDQVLETEKRLRVAAPATAAAALAALPGVRAVRPEGHGFLVTGRVAADTVRTVPGVTGVQSFDLSLEEVFWSYVEE